MKSFLINFLFFLTFISTTQAQFTFKGGGKIHVLGPNNNIKFLNGVSVTIRKPSGVNCNSVSSNQANNTTVYNGMTTTLGGNFATGPFTMSGNGIFSCTLPFATSTIPCSPNEIFFNPTKNDDMSSGITSTDIVLLNKHILGTLPITNSFDLIAADFAPPPSTLAGLDHKIATSDLVEMKKLVLGLPFTSWQSWRFINLFTLSLYQNANGNNSFITELNPLSGISIGNKEYPDYLTPFPNIFDNQLYKANALSLSNQGMILYGIKTGDINRTFANTLPSNRPYIDNNSITTLSESKSRVIETTLFETEKHDHIRKGERFWANISFSEFINLTAFQFALTYDSTSLAIQSVVPSNLANYNEESFGMRKRGYLKTLWYEPKSTPISIKDGEVVLRVEFLATEEISDVSKAIYINDEPMPIEFVTQDDEATVIPINIGIERMESEGQKGIYPNPVADYFQVYSNDLGNTNQMYRICNHLGKVIETGEKTNTKGAATIDFEVGSLQKGIYFLELTNGRGIKSVLRFIKE